MALWWNCFCNHVQMHSASMYSIFIEWHHNKMHTYHPISISEKVKAKSMLCIQREVAIQCLIRSRVRKPCIRFFQKWQKVWIKKLDSLKRTDGIFHSCGSFARKFVPFSVNKFEVVVFFAFIKSASVVAFLLPRCPEANTHIFQHSNSMPNWTKRYLECKQMTSM